MADEEPNFEPIVDESMQSKFSSFLINLWYRCAFDP
jgi:hypothetical protein